MSESPSKKKITVATVVALLVAAVVLVTAVLPAEYGLDPLGTGRALGLLDLAEAEAAPLAEPQSNQSAQAQPVKPGALAPGEIRTSPTLAGWNKDQPGVYRVDSRELEIAPGQGMEFKYKMEKGAGLVYVWNATAKVQYEFHGEPEAPAGAAKPKDPPYESYSKDDKVGKQWGAGNFIAPFTGIHGWYWKNTTTAPVFVQLTSSGFYTAAREFRKAGPIDHKLEDVKIEKRR